MTPDLTRPLRDTNSMSCLRDVQTISKSPRMLPMPSLTRLPTGRGTQPPEKHDQHQPQRTPSPRSVATTTRT